MAHFLLYIPRVNTPDPAHLHAVGLGDLLRDGDLGPSWHEVSANGPDGGAGMLVTWLDPTRPASSPIPKMDAARQTWTAAKPFCGSTLRVENRDAERRTTRPAGRFWIGIQTDSPPTPADLLRSNPLDGYNVTLGDGARWLVPCGMLLPHDDVINERGELDHEINRDHAALFARTRWAFDVAEKSLGDDGLDPDWRDVLLYDVEILSVNYRVNLDLATHLRLINSTNRFQVFCRSTDLPTLLAIQNEQKKTAAVSTPGSSPSTAGGAASPAIIAPPVSM